MVFNENSTFYTNAKMLLDEFVLKGGDVNTLGVKDKIYRYIQGTRAYDEFGNLLDVESKFKMLGHERKCQIAKDARTSLINKIEQFISDGGSFHIERKKLPFDMELQIYSNYLKRKGIYLTHEQIMKDDLGYREYSDTYFRCKGLSKLKQYKDRDGYVDEIKKNKSLVDYVVQVGLTYDIPYYLIITLLMDLKMTTYTVQLDKVKYVEGLLKEYLKVHGDFKSLKEKDRKTYNRLDYLSRYYSDGSEIRFGKKEIIDSFELGHVANNFKTIKQTNVNIEEIIGRLREQFPDGYVFLKKIDKLDYNQLIYCAVKKNISIKELLKIYGLDCKGSSVGRLSRTNLAYVPYLEEMKQERDAIIEELTAIQILKIKELTGREDVTLCKEERFEIKLSAVKQVYDLYRQQLETYVPSSECVDVKLYDDATSDN